MQTHKFAAAVGILAAAFLCPAQALEQRNEVSYFRGPHNTAFFHRHNETFMNGSAIHFAHGIQHDILEKSPLADHARVDEEINRRNDERLARKIRQHA